ncbi:MAG: phosphoglucosamine mutase [Verrucomicrobiota bacterium]
MSLKYFGTDGIRGKYGSSVLNESIAFRAGRSAAKAAKRMYGIDTPLLLIGRDTRASGESLEKAIAAGFKVEGGRVVSLGIAPTPAVAKMTQASEASLGCSVTASHNPSCDNGIKFFQSEGVKPSEALEIELDDGVGAADDAGWPMEGESEIESLESRYDQLVIEAFEKGFLRGKRIALDCANGAMAKVAPGVFEALGAEVVAIATEPDGENINDGVGSEHPEALLKVLEAGSFDMAFAFDGDGDRVMAFDESGIKLSGEAVIALLAIDAKAHGELSKDVLVTTVQSNLGLDAAMAHKGIGVERVDVGDKHLSRRMIADGYNVGGEESGHLVLGEFSMTGDGLYAALRIAQSVVRSRRALSSWSADYEAFPLESKAVWVKAKPPLETCSSLQKAIGELENELGEDGRLLIRYSGTEPKLRLLVEAKSAGQASEAMNRLLDALEQDSIVEEGQLAKA